MSRVKTLDIKRIINTELEDLSAFIQTASVQVDTIATLGLLGAPLLKEIERWLAAHYVALYERQDAKVTMGDSSHTYGGKTGAGLSYTRFGQQALLLDTTGTLSNGGLRRASMSYLGGVADDGEMEV